MADDWQEMREVFRLVHRVDHLRWRKGLDPIGLPEGEWVAECWMPDTPPDWALAAAAAGEPGSRWCRHLLRKVSDRD